MKKIIIFVLSIFCISLLSSAGNNTKTLLRFDKAGKFKILQFTDIHYLYNSYRSDSAMAMIGRAIKEEKPDLVIVTGDVVCSKNTKKAWLALSKTFIDAGIPWAVTLGNHDVEFELTGEEIMETICGLPNCVAENGPTEISGSGNYVLKVNSYNSSETKAVLYFLDTHTRLKKEKGWGYFDWIRAEQIQWYREQSKKFTMENGGMPYPSLAFFHIPLIEYDKVWQKKTTVGAKKEKVDSPDINSGMFSAFVEMNDVMGIFVGHDHVNNYIGCLHNICLAYGQSSGRDTYGDQKGYRVIELYEGQRKFDTWIRIKYVCDPRPKKYIWEAVKNEQPMFSVTYPDSFSE